MRLRIPKISYILTFCLLTICSLTNAQGSKTTNLINASLGLGPNYGRYGLKTVIGYNNSGLLLGAGMYDRSTFAYEIGGQISIGLWYINAGYAPYGRSIVGVNPPVTYGPNFTTGVNLVFGKGKRYFTDLGMGFSWQSHVENEMKNEAFFKVVLGLGYKFVQLNK